MFYISRTYFVGSVSNLPPYPDNSVEYKAMIFCDRIDGWHLEPADRMVNGWLNTDGTQAISASDKYGQPTNIIPDAAWAGLQCALSYFEIVGWFKFKANEKKRFVTGFKDVFTNYFTSERETEDVSEQVRELRNGLFHRGIRSSTPIAHFEPLRPIHLEQDGSIVVDPHVFIPHLRAHLRDFTGRLLDPSQVDLRDLFSSAYDEYYSS